MLPDPEIAAVLAQFGLTRGVSHVQRLENAGGFSGSRLWRITTTDGRNLCLRRWPWEHPSPERLQLIHTVLTHAAAHGIDFIPVPLRSLSGKTFIKADIYLWELVPWLPGTANFHE